MKRSLIVAALILMIAENGLAGVEYDRCIKEEKALKTQETGDCSGLKYLLNPSGCFATRKVLKEYASGKCKNIGISENVDFNVQKVVPEKKITNVGSVAAPITSGGRSAPRTETDGRPPEVPHDQLKAENDRLKAEIVRLKTENEQLRKLVR